MSSTDQTTKRPPLQKGFVMNPLPPVITWQNQKYAIWMVINEGSCICYNIKGEWFQFIAPLPEEVFKELYRKHSIWWCHELCNKNLRRPHVTCLTCWYRRVWEGKLPNMVPMEAPYITKIRLRNKSQSKVENQILKIIRVLNEVLSER